MEFATVLCSSTTFPSLRLTPFAHPKGSALALLWKCMGGGQDWRFNSRGEDGFLAQHFPTGIHRLNQCNHRLASFGQRAADFLFQRRLTGSRITPSAILVPP